MSKLLTQIESIHQQSVGYALAVLKETTRQLYLLNVPFPEILQTMAEVHEEEHCDVHATPRTPNLRSQARWEELYEDQHQFASSNLAAAGSQLLDLGMPHADIHEFLDSCLTGVCDSCQAAADEDPKPATTAPGPAPFEAKPAVRALALVR
jgi:hypothetical protein